MGMRLFSSCGGCQNTSTDPDPSRYSLNQVENIGDLLIYNIRYFGCTNYSGRKILVYFKDDAPEEGDLIDPHFLEGKKSPIARFEPTHRGFVMAVEFCIMMSNKKNNGLQNSENVS